MPNLTDLNKFFKKDNAVDGDILTFKDGGEILEVDFSKAKDGSDMKTVFQIVVILPDGKEKILTLNKTNQKSLSEKWGVITENWVGKKAKVNFIKQLAFGKLVDVLALEPIGE